MLKPDVIRFRVGFKWRSFLAQSPRIYSAWIGLRNPSHALGVNPITTDLVLEGFPRSGNTFAWYALMMAQIYPLNIAHNLHSPARVIHAARNDVPTLVLIREPKDCVISYCIYEPRLSLKLGFIYWLRFYKSIKPYSSKYVLATFNEVISDFGKVIKTVNDRFDTQFMVFDHTTENVQRVASSIEAKTHLLLKRSDSSYPIEDRLSVPSDLRARKKEALGSCIQKDENLLHLMNQAQSLYRSMVMKRDHRSGRQHL